MPLLFYLILPPIIQLSIDLFHCSPIETRVTLLKVDYFTLTSMLALLEYRTPNTIKLPNIIIIPFL
jgi:hypothetical protein